MKKSSKKVRIIVIAHQLNTGKVAKFGDEVDVAHLNGNLKELVDQKFVEEVEPSKDNYRDGTEVDVTSLNKDDLISHAESLDVEFDPSNTKNQIIQAIKDQKQ